MEKAKRIEITENVLVMVDWQPDTDPMLDWLGQFSSNPGSKFFVDRETGLLYFPDGRTHDTGITIQNDYRRVNQYWIPSTNHLPHDLKNWAHVSEEDCQIEIAKYGSLEQTDIHYALEDWQRHEAYGQTWEMAGCMATAYVNGIEIAGESLWGIESDAIEHREEIEQELVVAVLQGAEQHLRDLAAASADAIMHIRAYLKERNHA